MTYPDSDDYLSNVTDDYRPPHVRHADRVTELMKNEPLQLEVGGRTVTFHEHNMDHPDSLQEIAFLVRRLRYDQMMELSAGIGVPADVIHGWAQKMP